MIGLIDEVQIFSKAISQFEIECFCGCKVSRAGSFDVVKSKDGRSFAHMKFFNRDWYLVRRVPPGQTWHPANDQLAGTATYGKLSSDALSKAAAFSVPFAKLRWGEMLLASGDMRYWLVLDRSTVEECSTGKVNGQWHPPFIGASDASEGKVTQYCRAGAKEGE